MIRKPRNLSLSFSHFLCVKSLNCFFSILSLLSTHPYFRAKLFGFPGRCETPRPASTAIANDLKAVGGSTSQRPENSRTHTNRSQWVFARTTDLGQPRLSKASKRAKNTPRERLLLFFHSCKLKQKETRSGTELVPFFLRAANGRASGPSPHRQNPGLCQGRPEKRVQRPQKTGLGGSANTTNRCPTAGYVSGARDPLGRLVVHRRGTDRPAYGVNQPLSDVVV